GRPTPESFGGRSGYGLVVGRAEEAQGDVPLIGPGPAHAPDIGTLESGQHGGHGGIGPDRQEQAERQRLGRPLSPAGAGGGGRAARWSRTASRGRGLPEGGPPPPLPGDRDRPPPGRPCRDRRPPGNRVRPRPWSTTRCPHRSRVGRRPPWRAPRPP